MNTYTLEMGKIISSLTAETEFIKSNIYVLDYIKVCMSKTACVLMTNINMEKYLQYI